MRAIGIRATVGALIGAAVIGAAGCTAGNTSTTQSGSTTPPTASVAPAISDQDVSDAYIYLLGRLLVARQEQLDFKEGFVWNQLVHRKPGAVVWPNPNLDVAYSEAWIAVDESSCTLVTVPKITGRYYTVQFLNGWGETLANINERTYPNHPSGTFAACLKGAAITPPVGAVRIDLPVKYTRVLCRVELGDDWAGAERLQHQFVLKATGSPKLRDTPKTPMFDANFPGVEAFDAGDLALDTDADLNPGMETLQAKVRAIATLVHDPAEHARIDKVIHDKAFADIEKAVPNVGHGTVRNGWALPATSGTYGDDYLTRTLVNYAGIWANTRAEVVYYKGFHDGSGAQLQSDNSYTLTFPKDALPQKYARYFWSVIAVDAVNKRVLPNPMKRYLLNRETKPQYGKDGSLTLYFAPGRPAGAPNGNWLPTPKGQAYNLTFRFYGPLAGVDDRSYFPPPLVKMP